METVELTVNSEQGLHGLPVDRLIRAANQFSCDIKINNLTTGTDFVNAKSILRVLSLGVYNGHVIHIRAEGTDELQVIEGISALVQNNSL